MFLAAMIMSVIMTVFVKPVTPVSTVDVSSSIVTLHEEIASEAERLNLENISDISQGTVDANVDINPDAGKEGMIVEEPEPEVVAEPPATSPMLINISPEEKEVLCRIVEAEVTGENPKGVGAHEGRLCKFRVARVIINRVLDPRFPNTVSGVVFDRRFAVQFTPTADGRYYSVSISNLTREAVDMALRADVPDDINGALYFMRGRYGKKAVILRDAVGHRYYK